MQRSKNSGKAAPGLTEPVQEVVARWHPKRPHSSGCKAGLAKKEEDVEKASSNSQDASAAQRFNIVLQVRLSANWGQYCNIMECVSIVLSVRPPKPYGKPLRPPQ